MKNSYYPFLVGASLYQDYWAVISPEKVRPLVISKAAIRGSEFGLYHRKIIYEGKHYEILYSFAPVLKKYMTSDENDNEVLLDKLGRPIHMFYGVFGTSLPLNFKLFELAENFTFLNLSTFLNDKDEKFSITSKPLEFSIEGTSIANELKPIQLEPFIIDQDIFTSSTKGRISKKEDKDEKTKEENIHSRKNEKEDKITENRTIKFEDKNKEDDTLPVNGEDAHSISIKKIGGSALVLFGLGLAAYSGAISFVSALVTGTGVALIASDNKSEKNKGQN